MGSFPSQKAKAAEFNLLYGRLAILEELIDGMKEVTP